MHQATNRIPAGTGDGTSASVAPALSRPLFTKKSLCAYLGVSPSTLDRLVSAGTLVSCRIGGQVRFRPDDVENFIARTKD
jgi:excisionase family DNA binding protein